MVSFFMQDRIYAGEKMDALKMKYEEMKNDMVDLKNDAADIEKIMAIYPYHAFIDIEMLIACSFILLGVEVIMTSMNHKMMYN